MKNFEVTILRKRTQVLRQTVPADSEEQAVEKATANFQDYEEVENDYRADEWSELDSVKEVDK